MAFSESNLACFGTALAGDTIQRVNIWVYITDDAFADVDNAGYFADMVERGLLGENDLIYILASDNQFLGRLTNVTNASTIVIADLDVTVA